MRYFFALLMLIVSGCSSEPNSNDIKGAISEKLTSIVMVAGVDVKASESVGSEVEPKFRMRFVAEVEYLVDLYERVSYIGGDVRSDVLRLVTPKGTRVKLFGIAESSLVNEKWQTVLTDLKEEKSIRGLLFKDFQNAVVEGSAEHEVAVKHYEEWQESEKERLRKVQEQKQAAELKEQKERELERKHLLEEKKAQEAQRNKGLKKVQVELQGTWKGHYFCRSSNAVMVKFLPDSNGSLVANWIFSYNGAGGNAEYRGSFTPNKSFKLYFDHWVQDNPYVRMVPWSGKIVNDNFIKGDIPGCGTFEISKVVK